MDRLEYLEGPVTSRIVTSDSPSGTVEIGRRLGRMVPPGTVISLEGGLGAGKTLLAKGICSGLGVEDEVLSPSFILVEEYGGDIPVLHFDLYRLDELEEVENLGLLDAVDGRNVVIVEWGDRLPEDFLAFDIRAAMRMTGPRSRDITLTASVSFLETLLEGTS